MLHRSVQAQVWQDLLEAGENDTGDSEEDVAVVLWKALSSRPNTVPGGTEMLEARNETDSWVVDDGILRDVIQTISGVDIGRGRNIGHPES